MPRCVRNFWIDGSVDGRESVISGGPKSKDGGIYLNIFVRDDGDVVHALNIRGRSDGERLHLVVQDCMENKVLLDKETKR